jgi:hypothetical protein
MNGRYPNSTLYQELKTAGGSATMIGDFSSADGEFFIAPVAPEIFDIESIVLEMTLAASVDDTKFGDITALTNGVVVKAFEDGVEKVDWTPVTWKSNNDFEKKFQLTNDLSDKTMFGEWLFRTPVRLDGGKTENITVSFDEDLTGVATFFRMIATGNIVKHS